MSAKQKKALGWTILALAVVAFMVGCAVTLGFWPMVLVMVISTIGSALLIWAITLILSSDDD